MAWWARLFVLAFGLPVLSGAASQRQAESDLVVPPGGQVARQSDGRVIPQAGPAPTRSAAARQLSTEAPLDDSTLQLTGEARSTDGAAPLSRSADGRPPGVTRLGGEDRCDPARVSASAVRCRRAIETRSAEFAAPPPAAMSPEERLLSSRERTETIGVRAVVDRIGRNNVDADAVETQAIASIALAPSPAEAPDIDTPAQAGAVDAIIQIIDAAQPNSAPR